MNSREPEEHNGVRGEKRKQEWEGLKYEHRGPAGHSGILRGW
jgi:hypothetical protein